MLSTFARPGVFPLEPISLCSVLSFGRRLATVQVSGRIGKGRKILGCNTRILTYFASVISVVQKGNVQVCQTAIFL